VVLHLLLALYAAVALCVWRSARMVGQVQLRRIAHVQLYQVAVTITYQPAAIRNVIDKYTCLCGDDRVALLRPPPSSRLCRPARDGGEAVRTSERRAVFLAFPLSPPCPRGDATTWYGARRRVVMERLPGSGGARPLAPLPAAAAGAAAPSPTLAAFAVAIGSFLGCGATRRLCSSHPVSARSSFPLPSAGHPRRHGPRRWRCAPPPPSPHAAVSCPSPATR